MATPKLSRRLANHSRVTLDTAPIIYFLVGDVRRAGVTADILSRTISGNMEIIVSVVTVAELLVAPLRLGDGDAASTVRSFVDGTPGLSAVEVSREIAEAAAEIRARKGLSLADAIIAATAVASGCTALVGNDVAFRRLGDPLDYIHVDDMSPKA